MHVYTCKVSTSSPTNPQVPVLVGTLTDHPETDNGVLDDIIREVMRLSEEAGDFDIADNCPACLVTLDQEGDYQLFRWPTLSDATIAAYGMGMNAIAVLFFERDKRTPVRIYTHKLTVIKYGESITWR